MPLLTVIRHRRGDGGFSGIIVWLFMVVLVLFVGLWQVVALNELWNRSYAEGHACVEAATSGTVSRMLEENPNALLPDPSTENGYRAFTQQWLTLWDQGLCGDPMFQNRGMTGDVTITEVTRHSIDTYMVCARIRIEDNDSIMQFYPTSGSFSACGMADVGQRLAVTR